MHLPYVTGAFTTQDLQEAFAAVSEDTTSSPSGLHYTLWKSLAKEDDLASWLATMMSLPFLYRFVNERWTKVVDIMLEKKPGVPKIRLL